MVVDFLTDFEVYGGERPLFIVYGGERDQNGGHECQYSRYSSDQPLIDCRSDG